MKKTSGENNRWKKNVRKNNVNVQKSRKQLRKEQRLLKKAKKKAYFERKKNPSTSSMPENNHKTIKNKCVKDNIKRNEQTNKSSKIELQKDINKHVKDSIKRKEQTNKSSKIELQKDINKRVKDNIKRKEQTNQYSQFFSDKAEIEQLQKDMQNQRIKQLKRANEDDDKEIKKLEKQLNLNKRKRKSIPKSFASDGLDYLLEVCEQDNMKEAMLIEDSDSDFEEDFSLMTGTHKKSNKEKQHKNYNRNDQNDLLTDEDNSINCDDRDDEEDDDDDDDDENATALSSEEGTDNYINFQNEESKHDTKDYKKKYKNQPTVVSEENYTENIGINSSKRRNKLNKNQNLLQEFEVEDIKEESTRVQNDEKNNKSQTNKPIQRKEKKSKKKNKKEKGDIHDNINTEKSFSDEDELQSDNENKVKGKNDDEETYWEDIYGRTRDRKGNIVQVETSKYIPPHLRAKATEDDNKKREQLLRLKKQMKGFLNRLAESNMSSISSQIEELYMSHSRNDMNESLTNLLMESLVTPVITPERLIMEHAMLIAILHANVGTEVGAHILQTLVKKFDEQCQLKQEVENKEVDNIVLILSHLYNFKVFNGLLLYNMLEKLAEVFGEKEVELILLILKTVGLSLRKDDPLALKDLILRLQQKASAAVQLKNSARVRFMLEVLLAIKNNNMTKIPNYDPNHIEHLKKIMKGFLRRGNYVTELKISLEDLLKADERGRWWVVGSAWTGVLPGENEKQDSNNSNDCKEKNTSSQYSQQVLELARKQRMNTDVRRNVFCILMTAEDFLDAFEKLLRLGLKNQLEREIIYVIMHCCLQEKEFNPYYCHLVQKFCDFDRKYQIIVQYALWDKIKDLKSISPFQLTNLAKFLVHLVLEKGLPLSVLKVIHFTEVDKVTVRFLRQVLLGILLHDSHETVQEVFQRIALSQKLHLFREGIRLFIHHFLLRNIGSLASESVELLQQRVNMADKILVAADSKLKL